MKWIFSLLLLVSFSLKSQKLKKADRAIVQNLQSEIAFLSDDKLEGRETGSAGEKLAADYLVAKFNEIGLIPKGENASYLQKFDIDQGKTMMPASRLLINGEELRPMAEYFPLLFGSEGSLQAFSVPAFKEHGSPWFLDIKDLAEKNSANPHFDYEPAIRAVAAGYEQKGANAVFVFNSNTADDDLAFHPFSSLAALKIPVIYITKVAAEKHLTDPSSNLEIDLKLSVGDKKNSATNVIGMLDNGAPHTTIIGAHYDHLGYGEHNSLWTGARSIHNGADDNASGTALILEMARMLKKARFKKNNYLFICFSGEEMGLYGSKYFTNHPTIDLEKVNYMVNADMVGRLNPSTHLLTVGGVGTSPAWSKVFDSKSKYFQFQFDSSGIGPSDHTAFYLKDIPVLFFFTGSHKDYHKPSDDADKINYVGELQVIKFIYDVIEKTNSMDKLAFSKTAESGPEVPRFTVSLGIMPDYTYNNDDGVRADAVVDGRAAQKAGILAGDVINAIDNNSFTDLMSYMNVLSKYKKGETVKVTLQREGQQHIFELTF